MKLTFKTLTVVGASMLATSVLAADPWISVPSTPTIDQRMVISGGDLPPGAAVNLRIQHPSGAVTNHAVNADTLGKLRFEYALTVTGGYGVELFDTSGKLIGGGRLGFFR